MQRAIRQQKDSQQHRTFLQSMPEEPYSDQGQPNSVRTYTLDKIRQLIDLNGDSTNFDISFKVTSRNGEVFDIVVVDQTTLDT